MNTAFKIRVSFQFFNIVFEVWKAAALQYYLEHSDVAWLLVLHKNTTRDSNPEPQH